jgi:hypothetical protein
MVGECPTVKGHITKTIFPLLDEAQGLIDKVCIAYGWPSHKVRYLNRKTIHTFANYYKDELEIRVYVPINGNSICTLLHEICHYISYQHNKVFKDLHKQLLKEYLLGKFPLDI